MNDPRMQQGNHKSQVIKDGRRNLLAAGVLRVRLHHPAACLRGNAIFGPVITPIPRGEAAGRLWERVVLVTEADGFFELKRTRDRKPAFDSFRRTAACAPGNV